MAKYTWKNKENSKLEAQVIAYLTKTIIGSARNYRKNYFKLKNLEISKSGIDEIYSNETYQQEYFLDNKITRENLLTEEEMFENKILFDAFQKLKSTQKEILISKFVYELPETWIAKIIGFSRQNVAKQRKAAFEIIVNTFFIESKKNK